MASPIPSSASGDDSISRQPSTGPLYSAIANRVDEFRRYFEVDRTIEFCHRRSVQKLALQLPDYLLWASARLARLLAEFHAVVLADSSFSPCCVDEIAAEHITADAIVHYGHRACLSQTLRIPVIHVFGALPVDVRQVVAQWSMLAPHANVVIVADLHYIESLREQSSLFPEGVQVARVGRRCAGFDFDGEPDAVLHVGGDESIRTMLGLHYPDAARFVYDPTAADARLQQPDTARAKAVMRRRRFLIEKVKNAETIGIVAGTLAVSGYMDCIRYLQKLIRDSGRRCYTVSIGKLNAAKIANFVGIDIFVMVACPMSCVVDSYDLSVDVVTPVDVDLALNSVRCPYRRYSTDFQTILSAERDECECCAERDGDSDEAAPRFSLISGKLVSGGEEPTANALNMVATVGKTRSFTGLDPSIGSTPVRPVEMGQIGIPSAYRPL